MELRQFADRHRLQFHAGQTSSVAHDVFKFAATGRVQGAVRAPGFPFSRAALICFR